MDGSLSSAKALRGEHGADGASWGALGARLWAQRPGTGSALSRGRGARSGATPAPFPGAPRAGRASRRAPAVRGLRAPCLPARGVPVGQGAGGASRSARRGPRRGGDRVLQGPRQRSSPRARQEHLAAAAGTWGSHEVVAGQPEGSRARARRETSLRVGTGRDGTGHRYGGALVLCDCHGVVSRDRSRYVRR